ncbi:hypothetical protein JXA47_08205, partial [Candidatus Sumerlaeota bacterium]|nr:hypothetical protein [Candidatus Sumerlaeota bacterium]
TIALWSALQVSSDLFKVTAPSPARITRVANEVVTPSRVFPTDGLNPAQMCKAITSFGLEPDVFDFDRTGGIPILSLIHGYVSRMRLPVVLGIDVEGLSPHAVTIVGYSLRKKRVLEREVHPARYQIPLVGMRVDAVYAHDDQHGPFARMDVDVPRVLAYIQAAEEYAEKLKKAPETITDDERVQERCPVIFKGTWQVSGNLRALDPYVALIPVHSRIRVNYTKVLEWVSRLHRLMEISGLLMGVEHITEWDVYLSSTNLFKAEIIQQPNLCSDKLRRVLLSANLPKFIWRAVFSLGGAPLLDILFDATDMKLSLPIERLTISQPYLKKVFSKMLGSFQPDFLNRALSPRLLTLFQQAIADGSATVS